MNSPFNYAGKTVFVSGGTSGINLGIAHAFARAGAKIAVISRKQDKVDAAVADLKGDGGEAIGFSADVRDYASVEEALKNTHAKFGEIDVLMDNAARREMEDRSGGARTVPQIFIGDAHVGGCDDLHALEREGKLDALLA